MHLFQIDHLYYTSIKDIVEKYRTPRMRLRQQLDKLLYAVFLCRIAFILYMIIYDFPAIPLFANDYIIPVIRENIALYDQLFVLSFLLMGTFIFIAQHQLNVSQVNTVTWQFFYILVVQNIDIFEKCRKSSAQLQRLHQVREKAVYEKVSYKHWPMPKKFLKLYCALKANWSIWINMDHVNKGKIAHYKLPVNFDIPIELRTKLIITITIIEKIGLFYQLFIYFLIASFTLKYVPVHLSVSLWYFPTVLLDQILIYYLVMATIQSTVYCFCSNIGVFVYCFKLKYFHGLFRGIIKQNQILCTNISAHSHIEHLRAFLHDHTVICYQILYGNEQIWSKVLLMFFVTIIPPNIYFFCRIFLADSATMPATESLTICIIFSGQTFFALIVLLGHAQQSKLIHHFYAYIPTIQILLKDRAYLNIKLKLDALLQRLGFTPKYGISIGPFKVVITYETIFQILMNYIYWVLFYKSKSYQV